ncbi:hypothetical protein HDU93_004839 [Gonapodya sp. JEL0774]|nr:hypothetical protein HDU93_004839 [Gonapodya sp. JEL0774]
MSSVVLGLLLDCGVVFVDEQGQRNLLELASESGHHHLVGLLLARGQDSQSRNRALFSACRRRDLMMVQQLLAAGADVHASDTNKALDIQQPDHALFLGMVGDIETISLPVLQLLLTRGANVDAYNGFGLNKACRTGSLDLAKFLLEWGADVQGYGDAMTSGKHLFNRPLASASRIGHVRLVRTLLAYGADVRADDCEALRFAIVYHRPLVVAVLLRAGVRRSDVEAMLREYRFGAPEIRFLLKLRLRLGTDN